MDSEFILNGNKIIAEFMNERKDDRFYFFSFLKSQYKTGWASLPNMQFHQSWDWLMPVVEKITTTKYFDGDTAYLRTFGMINPENGACMVRFNRSFLNEEKTLMEATYKACIEFIKYSKNELTV